MGKNFQKSESLPAGKYFIGDPCYVIAEKKWSKFCDLMFDGSSDLREEIKFEFENQPIVAMSTAYGDGTFYDNHGNSYGVDSGTLGLTPISLCEKRALKDMDRLGKIWEFEKPITVFYENGNFDIQSGIETFIQVITDGSDEIEEEDDEYDYLEDDEI